MGNKKQIMIEYTPVQLKSMMLHCT